MTLKEISQPVEKHIKEFETYFKSIMKSNVSLLDLILQYITRKQGKQIRPSLVFLSAGLCGSVNQRSIIGAAMLELLHTATLIHDDVVDEASERRGLASINAAWSNKIAVLIGDFLLGKGLLAAVDNNEHDFLKALSTTVKRMSEGELLQIQKSKEIDKSEETYFKIISDKTASLLSTCCEVGALSATDDKEKINKLRLFGEYLGIAFQIRDDIFDFVGHSKTIGKAIGNDLKEKKMTLPLIYSLSKVQHSEAKEIIKLVKSNKISKKEIRYVLNFVMENGGIDFSELKAREYIQLAVSQLTDFPDSEYKHSLLMLADFVIERES